MLIEIYNAILYQPLLNLLVFFYNVIPGHDVGIAIILLTIFIKVILSPFFVQSIKAQKRMQILQPKIDELKEKYKGQQDKLGPALMELYKKEKINPLSSCLPLLLQLPFLIAVYQVFSAGLSSGSLEMIYPFISNPGTINPVSFGLINLSHPSSVMAVLAGAAQFWQSKMMMAKRPNKSSAGGMAGQMGAQMTYIMPLVTIFIGTRLPAGLTLYWFLMTLLSALQQLLVFKKMDKPRTTFFDK